MRKLVSGLTPIGFVPLLLLGCGVSWPSAMFGASQSGSGVIPVTDGQVTTRPIVNNGRVLFFRTGVTGVSIVLATNVRPNQQPTLTVIAVDGVESRFAGPPDLDEYGNVVYVRNVAGLHHVFLYDGATKTHLQLTGNANIAGSPTIGLGSSTGTTGWPRVANKHVVFRDRAGNVYLYNPNNQSIRRINPTDAETSNVRNGDVFTGIAERKHFEFDGRTIVWLHERVIRARYESEMTLYLAKPPYDAPPRPIATFRAWTPGQSFVGGAWLVDPFFVACADKVAWQYFPPTNLQLEGRDLPPGLRPTLNDAIIGYFDGTSVSEHRRASLITPRIWLWARTFPQLLTTRLKATTLLFLSTN